MRAPIPRVRQKSVWGYVNPTSSETAAESEENSDTQDEEIILDNCRNLN